MGEDLCKYSNSSSYNATWSSSRDKIVRIAQALVHPISCREFNLGRGLVQLRVVEFVQPVLGECEHLLGGSVRCHESLVLGILILTLSSCFSHGLVQCADPGLQC